MQIRVSDIPSKGLEIELSPSLDWVAAAAQDAIGLPLAHFEGEAKLGPPDKRGTVDVSIRTSFSFRTECDRCLEPLEVRIDETHVLRYFRSETEQTAHTAEEEIELGEDDLDAGWYTAGTLSLADALSEAVALALPMRNACVETTGCDARTAELLRRAAEPEGGHPGFAALKNWT